MEIGINMEKIQKLKKVSMSLFKLSLVVIGIMNITLNLRRFSGFEFIRRKYKMVVSEEELKVMETYDNN